MKQETIDRIRKFTADREWEQYHTPANLAKSISIEANELLECFQWSDDDYDLVHVKEELADVEVQKEIPVEDMNGEMKNAKIPDSKYHIVATKYCENELETANKQAKAILQNYPDVKLIYGTNENSTTGICDAVAEMGKAGEVKVIGFNASDKEVAYIQDGTLTGTIVQNPYNMGYLGVKYADSAVHGDTSDLLPELITSVTLVTEENLNNEDIRFLINPVTN